MTRLSGRRRLCSIAGAIAVLVMLVPIACGETYLDAIVEPGTTGAEDASGGGGFGGSCPQGQSLCDGTCSDTQANDAHCGACDNACSAVTTCVAGTCCPIGFGSCNGICVNTMTSNEHCGTCGNQCGLPSFCVTGVCTCAGVLLYCDGLCVNTYTDPKHCGTCGHECPIDSLCFNGACL